MLRPLALVLLSVSAGPAVAQCRLCAPQEATRGTDAPQRPLSIEVEAALDLGRAATLGGSGSIALDERTGLRRVEGLRDLGGFALKGRARIVGEPFRQVRVVLPPSVRLVAPNGATAEAVEIRADLGPAPVLGADGTLSFTFGGRLIVANGVAGDFRGRIAITADYD